VGSISNAGEEGFEKAFEYRLSRIVFRGGLGGDLLLGFVLEGKDKRS
jgi:hypothetical protein